MAIQYPITTGDPGLTYPLTLLYIILTYSTAPQRYYLLPSRQAPAPPQTSTSPSTPYQSQVVPPIMIRREGDGYQVVPGPVQQVSPLLTPQSVPCLPWPLPSVPPSPFWPPLTPQSPLTAPWSWPTSYQPQATRL